MEHLDRILNDVDLPFPPLRLLQLTESRIDGILVLVVEDFSGQGDHGESETEQRGDEHPS